MHYLQSVVLFITIFPSRDDTNVRQWDHTASCRHLGPLCCRLKPSDTPVDGERYRGGGRRESYTCIQPVNCEQESTKVPNLPVRHERAMNFRKPRAADSRLTERVELYLVATSVSGKHRLNGS